MGKFREKLLIALTVMIILGGLSFNYLTKQKNTLQSSIKHDQIVMYIQDETGKYNLSSTKRFPTQGYELNTEKSKCSNGSTLSQDEKTKKISVSLSQSDQCTLYYDKEKPKIVLGETTIPIQEPQEGIPNFAEAATADETKNGLYSLVDDSGKSSYYYRGAVENNYVKFGVDKDGNDMYWRIIRFNGDGSMRIQYDGKANGHSDTNFTYTRVFSLINQVWNSKHDDAKYVGWMFGGAQGAASTSKAQAQKNETPSDIKTAVDTWYKENIVDTGYHDYIADEIFCNDRSMPGVSVTGWVNDTGLGYGKNWTGYGAIAREGWNQTTNYANPKPSFVCPRVGDKFTVSESSGGNGKLTYPVGLITADEIVAAGSGKFNTQNTSYYLQKGSTYWSFSPFYMINVYADMFFIDSNGNLFNATVHNSGSVATVINIKAEYVSQLVGDGTSENPFRLKAN